MLSRRSFLRRSGLGGLGLSLPTWLALLQANASGTGSATARAKSAIVLFAWGGLSHLDSWDPKPEGGADIRGEFLPIETATPGVFVSEALPHLSRQTNRLAIVRSVHHDQADHRLGAYWNITGHAPTVLGAEPPSRRDWPSLGSMVSVATEQRRRREGNALPGTMTLPYPIADRGLLNGQYGGFLGSAHDPVFATPPTGTKYAGVSPNAGIIDLDPRPGVDRQRIGSRRSLLSGLERAGQPIGTGSETDLHGQWHARAMDMLLQPEVRHAFDLTREPQSLHERYGSHLCGQSVLLARRLSEAGVPLVTVNCAAGDLNGSAGSHFDTHGNNFNRLRNDMLPPLDRASSALLDDLADRGRLDDTLVVWMTEFGRTPKINGAAGRDHFPNCYSVAFAGAGVRGSQVFGRSDKMGSKPVERACTPADLHATIFKALGIDPHFPIEDLTGRPLPLCDGEPLPLW